MKQKTASEIENRERKAKRLATFLIEKLIVTMSDGTEECKERWLGASLQSGEKDIASLQTRVRVLELLRAARPL